MRVGGYQKRMRSKLCTLKVFFIPKPLIRESGIPEAKAT